jgi:hypothetical protein
MAYYSIPGMFLMVGKQIKRSAFQSFCKELRILASNVQKPMRTWLKEAVTSSGFWPLAVIPYPLYDPRLKG